MDGSHADAIDTVEVGGRTLAIARPPDAEALLDEEAFGRDEFLPYWAELWPSAVALARAVAGRRSEGLRVVELGCGLGLPSLAAAAGGASVLATDWSADALAYTRRNARRNRLPLETLRVDWARPEELLARAPFDLVLAADVLYERRNVDGLLALLPALAAEALVADPGRPALPAFLAGAAGSWEVEAAPAAELPRGSVHRLSRRVR